MQSHQKNCAKQHLSKIQRGGILSTQTVITQITILIKSHTGKIEIEKWIAHSNEKYRSVMKPLAYDQAGDIGILSTEVSGTFPGSPLILKFHFEIRNGLIQPLKVTG